ncbi:hypothetical protein EDD18DRAFT_1214926 [Armillaria luteobubalina]|uniref:Secreted protein n=1 Tax=Armillaria luteobubalina TaxID=153913 RepID=A0AA39P2U8_9AGAR|nr:hypothetical protein EDD18DRAFT_1214926 [Armillaria luteobubalina]
MQSTAMVFHWCLLLQREHSTLTGWPVVESTKTASATNTSCKMNSTTPPNRNFGIIQTQLRLQSLAVAISSSQLCQ